MQYCNKNINVANIRKQLNYKDYPSSIIQYKFLSQTL